MASICLPLEKKQNPIMPCTSLCKADRVTIAVTQKDVVFLCMRRSSCSDVVPDSCSPIFSFQTDSKKGLPLSLTGHVSRIRDRGMKSEPECNGTARGGRGCPNLSAEPNIHGMKAEGESRFGRGGDGRESFCWNVLRLCQLVLQIGIVPRGRH
jgi:hypothetical protein